MTFPAVIYSTDGIIPGIAGTATGLLFAYNEETRKMIEKQEENILNAGKSFQNVRDGICETADVMAYIMDLH